MEQIYRKKSLDRVKSPEQLNDYIRVANPGIWLFILAVALFVVGAVVWGTSETAALKMPAAVMVGEDGLSMKVLLQNTGVAAEKPENGMTLYVGDETCKIEKIGNNGIPVSVNSLDSSFPNDYEALSEMGWTDEEFVVRCEATGTKPLEPGFYKGTLVLKNVSPFKLLGKSKSQTGSEDVG